MLKKGDLLVYGGHIAMVYSDRWGQSSWVKGGIFEKEGGRWTEKLVDLEYNIIHAYGMRTYIDVDLDYRFSRKVIVTGDNLGTTKRAKRFGRITLWD